jgi:hypothetical protein
MLVIAIPTNGMIYAYFKIWQLYRGRLPAASGKKRDLMKVNERKLLNKSMILCGSFYICWSPYMVLILITLINGKPASSLQEEIVGHLTTLNTIFNPALMIVLEKKVRFRWSLFGLKAKDKMEPDKTIQVAVMLLCPGLSVCLYAIVYKLGVFVHTSREAPCLVINTRILIQLTPIVLIL